MEENIINYIDNTFKKIQKSKNLPSELHNMQKELEESISQELRKTTESGKKVASILERLLNTYPSIEVARKVTKLVEVLKDDNYRVGDIEDIMIRISTP